MKLFEYSPEARQDINDITDYILRDNLSAAIKLSDKFEKACDNLAHMPMMGHVRSDITDKQLRFWSVGVYCIVYNPHTTPLQIVRILHGQRNIEEII